MKILHVGLCVQPKPYNGFQQAFIDVVGEDNYREIATGDPQVNEKTQYMIAMFKPDILFMQIQAPNIISIETCEYAKNSGCFVINWTGDKRHEVPQWMVDLAPFVNCTSFSNMEDVYKMRALGFKSDFLEIGYDQTIYTPIGEALQIPEIVFMGNNYGRGYFPMSGFRIDMVDFLKNEYGNRFGVYGSGWAYANGNFNHSQHEEAKAYRGAKIAINVSHFDCDIYNSDRLLRILGSGCACVSYEHINMGYNEKCLKFKDFNLLKIHINRLLSDDILRGHISKLGESFVKNNHTFKHQVENIINLAA